MKEIQHVYTSSALFLAVKLASILLHQIQLCNRACLRQSSQTCWWYTVFVAELSRV